MRFVLVNLAIWLLALSGFGLTAPVEEDQKAPRCRTISKRKAWHTLTKGEKKAYINAELCLMKRKATAGLPHARTKFDELQETHVILSEVVHHVGAFLPFHRYLMWAHEYLLRTECKYTGTQPYWQEQADAGNFLGSPLLDPDTGFGGNGRAGDGCITNGPFANYVNPLGPGYNVSDHCIYRRVDETVSLRAGQQFVDECMAFNTFEQAWPCMEFWPHRAGHGGVNGLMIDPISSPGDPLFYMHHTWLDKVWWDWQQVNPSARLYDLSGRNVVPFNDSHRTWPTRPAILNQTYPLFPIKGDSGNVTTFNHVLTLYGIVRDTTVGEVMDTRSGFLCYEYVNP